MITSKEIIEQFEIISHNIKFYRQNQNMSQEELAEKSDLSISYIKQLESGKIFKNLSLTTLLKLSKALNININKLFYKIKTT
ncbi:MAG: helix-turn-helix transcriptional regulator [Bacilli bacterium]